MHLIYLIARSEIKFTYNNGKIEYVDWNTDKRIPYLTEDYLEDIYEHDVLEFIENYMMREIRREENSDTKIEILSINLEEAFYLEDEDNPKYF